MVPIFIYFHIPNFGMWQGKIQRQMSRTMIYIKKNTETHTKRYNGVSATKEVSKKQNGPNEDY
jgi:hypothetical protein